MHADSSGWFVEWQVIQSTYIGTGVRGRAYFTNENLQAAFGLTNQSGEFGDWLIKDFGADVAEQGTYIRTGLYLNIPCPGTGHDGDPNVSILLDDEMRQAITELLA